MSNTRRMHTEITKDIIKEMRGLRLEGKTYKEIGAIYNLCISAVFRYCCQDRIQVGKHHLIIEQAVEAYLLHKQGWLMKEIAVKHKVCPEAVKTRIHNYLNKKGIFAHEAYKYIIKENEEKFQIMADDAITKIAVG